MIHLEFTPEETEALDYERFHHPHPKVQKKMEVLYLKAKGLPHQEICRLCGISRPTLVSYLKQYQAGGIEGLKHLGYQGQPSELSKHTDTLKAHFEAHPPRTIAEAQAAIERLTGIKRSPTQVRAFLKRLGMKCRKVGYVPGKAVDPDALEAQETFKREELEPRLKEAKAGPRKVYFMDASHFVFKAFLGFVWCFERLFLPSPSGRKRFSVLGALDAVTKELLTVTSEAYINAGSVCKMFDQIARINQGLNVAITIFLDNARYQKNIFVQEYAAMYGIELVFLPPYAPHLNLIERYWRFVKKQCLYSKYYADFGQFKKAIQDCVAHAHTKHKDKLKSLLAWKFQSFEKVKISAV